MTPTVERVVMRLVMAFDEARGAFQLQTHPGWDVASHELREALNAARNLGDVGSLPCPLSWWTSAQAQARSWLEAKNDAVRRGLTPAVKGTMDALLEFAKGTIEKEEPRSRIGGRS